MFLKGANLYCRGSNHQRVYWTIGHTWGDLVSSFSGVIPKSPNLRPQANEFQYPLGGIPSVRFSTRHLRQERGRAMTLCPLNWRKPVFSIKDPTVGTCKNNRKSLWITLEPGSENICSWMSSSCIPILDVTSLCLCLNSYVQWFYPLSSSYRILWPPLIFPAYIHSSLIVS